MTTAQDQQSRELLPCPFCGREAMMSHSRDGEVCNVRCAGWSVGNCLGAGPNCYTEADAAAGWNRRAPAEQAARALPAAEPVAGQCRFVGEAAWLGCAAEHVRAVLAAPQDWEGYEVRYLYAEAPRSPAAQKRYRLLARNVDTIQADDEFLRDADSTWQIDPQGIFVGMPYMSNVLLPARRAVEPSP